MTYHRTYRWHSHLLTVMEQQVGAQVMLLKVRHIYTAFKFASLNVKLTELQTNRYTCRTCNRMCL